MKRRRWFRGQRFGEYQLTIRQDLTLVRCLIFSRHTGAGAALVLLGVALYFGLGLVWENSEWPELALGSYDRAAEAIIRFLSFIVPELAAAGVMAHRAKERRNAVLRRMGFPICVKCDYDLKGLAGDPLADRCPECGSLIADMPPVGE